MTNPKDFKVGDRVILGCHDNDDSGSPGNWALAMDDYVGKLATITQSAGRIDRDGFVVAEVDIDRGHHHWRLANMTPALPPTCVECNTLDEYAEPTAKPHFCGLCRRRAVAFNGGELPSKYQPKLGEPFKEPLHRRGKDAKFVHFFYSPPRVPVVIGGSGGGFGAALGGGGGGGGGAAGSVGGSGAGGAAGSVGDCSGAAFGGGAGGAGSSIND